MKKLIALLLSLLIICGLFAACGDKADTSGDDDNKGTSSSQAAQGEGSGNGNGEGGGAAASKVYKSADIKYDSEVIVLTYDADAKTLEFKMLSYAPDDVLTQLNLTGTLAMVNTLVYNVTATEDGEYTILKGNPTVAKVGLEGTAAEGYIKAAEEAGADADYIEQLKGKTITDKAELENTTYMINEAFTAKVTLSGNKLTIIEIVQEYTEYGSQIPCKDIYQFENDVIRTREQFENGESLGVDNFNENGELIEDLNASNESAE